jgi:hypothetical protein
MGQHFLQYRFGHTLHPLFSHFGHRHSIGAGADRVQTQTPPFRKQMAAKLKATFKACVAPSPSCCPLCMGSSTHPYSKQQQWWVVR